MSRIRQKDSSVSNLAAVFLAVLIAVAVSGAVVAQYSDFGNPASTNTYAAPTTQYTNNPSFVIPNPAVEQQVAVPGQPASQPTYGGIPTTPQYPQNTPQNYAVQSGQNFGGQTYPAQPHPGQTGQVTQTPGQVPAFNQQPQTFAPAQNFNPPQTYDPQQAAPYINSPPAFSSAATPGEMPNYAASPYAASPYVGQASPDAMSATSSAPPAMSFGEPSASPALTNVPAFNPGGAMPGTTAGNYATPPAFQPPQFSAPPQAGNEPPLLAFGGGVGGIGNAYNYNGTGQTSGAAPAFQSPEPTTALANQGLAVRSRERGIDRKKADQECIEACNEIRDSRNTDAWMTPLPSYLGPLGNRGIGKGEEESSVLQVAYQTGTIKQDEYEYDWEQEEKHLFDFSMLDPTRFGERVKVWVGLGPDEEKARKHMEEALKLMKDGKHIDAAKKFEWAAYYWQETAVEEDARYHAAECYYREKRYNEAVKQYTKLLSNFQSSPYKNEAIKNMYEIAKTWIKQVTEDKVSYVNVSDGSRPTFDTFGYAERALKTIFINCPNDPMADDSVFLLAIGYMRLGKSQGDASFENAAEYFKQVRDCYPNSEFIAEAMRLEVICRERAGLGAEYDSKHLDEARSVAEQLRMQQGTRLPADQQNELLQITNRLTEEKAHKIWVTGQFWDSKKDYGAARMLYQELISKYPSTEYADKARKRYEQIRDLPAELPSDWERIKSAVTFWK